MQASVRSERQVSVLLYCDADLNLIDGSAVWTASVAQVLTRHPRVRLTLVLKRPLERDLLVGPLLKHPRVEVFDPYARRHELAAAGEAWAKSPRLRPEDAAALLAALDGARGFDVVLVRGLRLCRSIVEQTSLRGRIWAYLTDFTADSAEELRAIHEGAAKMLCQTPQLQAKIQRLLGVGPEKMLLLPPMIPDMDDAPPSLARQGFRIAYVGKLAPLWRSEEMVEALPELRKRFSIAELHVAGDKFHNFPPRDGFAEHMQALLEGTPGVIWHRALSREATQDMIRSCDLGYSWRHPDLDDSVELSTKLLEYGAHGKPVLLNRVPMHEELLGADYPLFCNTREEMLEAAIRAFSDPASYTRAAQLLWDASQRFTFSAALERIAPHLPSSRAAIPVETAAPSRSVRHAGSRPRVVFAGHDLKFASNIMEGLRTRQGFEVRADEWAGHNLHDEKHSQELAEWADVVVAEWCLGNAVWYTRHLPARTALVVRLHRVELTTDYPEQLELSRIHRLVAVSPHFAEQIAARLPDLEGRVLSVPNAVDCERLDKPKLGGSDFRLGMLGLCPKLKRLDLALDVFAHLHRRDRRYVLFVKGAMPTDYSWVWRQEEERAYYREVFARINLSPWRDSVVFDPFGDDVPVWFRKIGFILSTSDIESFHLSVAEGMASGAIPIIRQREEVSGLYPEEYVFRETREAADLIEHCRASPDDGRGEVLKSYCREHFDLPKVVEQWAALIARAREDR